MNIERYIEKRAPVEAVQLTRDNLKEVQAWWSANALSGRLPTETEHGLFYTTIDDDFHVPFSDYVINDEGVFSSMSPAKFKGEYQPEESTRYCIVSDDDDEYLCPIDKAQEAWEVLQRIGEEWADRGNQFKPREEIPEYLKEIEGGLLTFTQPLYDGEEL